MRSWIGWIFLRTCVTDSSVLQPCQGLADGQGGGGIMVGQRQHLIRIVDVVGHRPPIEVFLGVGCRRGASRQRIEQTGQTQRNLEHPTRICARHWLRQFVVR